MLIGIVAIAAAASCSDLLSNGSADVVVEIEADDQAQVLRTRQEVLATAPTWAGTRVGERTTGADETSLEFSLPGDKLELALAALDELDARVVSTQIDVDVDQIDRTPTTLDDRGEPPDPASRTIRLRVEVAQAGSPGAGALVGLVIVVFSLVGMVSTVGWIVRWWRRRDETSVAPRRIIDRVDLRDDPPTQETPRVPPEW